MNRINVNNAKVVYGNKRLVTGRDNKDVSLIEYFVQETVGNWKQNLLVKVFTEDLTIDPLENGTIVKFKGTLKINTYKDKVMDDLISKPEIMLDKVEDLKVIKVIKPEVKADSKPESK